MAAVHGNVGRRANDRKVVFKSVLENPFKIQWPHVPLNIQNTALAALITLLAGVAEYQLARQAASRKRKRARHDKARKEKVNAKKKRKLDDGSSVNVEADNTGAKDANINEAVNIAAEAFPADVDPMEMDSEDVLPPPPGVFSHLTFGINEVTKRLEAQSRALRPRTSIHPPSSTPAADSDPVPPPPLTHVFVCRADISPPLLIAHLPDLVAACNVPCPGTSQTLVHLIPLPEHAEHTIAEAVGLRRASVLALDSTTPSLETLASFLSSVQPPSAPWLTPPTTTYVPTHIKQVRTTAPRDMRAAKRERTDGRQAAKEKRKDKEMEKGKGKGKEKEKGNETGKEKGKEKEKEKEKQENKKQNGKNVHGKERARKEMKRLKITAPATASSKDPLPANL